MAKLLLKYEGVTLSSYKLEGNEVSVGRLAGNDIQLDDSAISGHHARVEIKPSAYLDSIKEFYLEDLGSTNGTRINDEKIDRELLKHGDIVQVGKHTFLFDSEQVEDMERTAIYIPGDE